MIVRDLFKPARAPSLVRVIAAAVIFPALATVAGLPINPSSQGGAVSLYLLAVVTASVLGGVPAGLGAALLSSASFSFFFTEPRYTFRIDRPEDIIAAIVYLAVAAIVGSLVARMVSERERATRGEQDARLLAYLSAKLLSGERLDRVMNDFAEALLDPFVLARCEIRASFEGIDIHAVAERPG